MTPLFQMKARNTFWLLRELPTTWPSSLMAKAMLNDPPGSVPRSLNTPFSQRKACLGGGEEDSIEERRGEFRWSPELTLQGHFGGEATSGSAHKFASNC